MYIFVAAKVIFIIVIWNYKIHIQKNKWTRKKKNQPKEAKDTLVRYNASKDHTIYRKTTQTKYIIFETIDAYSIYNTYNSFGKVASSIIIGYT